MFTLPRVNPKKVKVLLLAAEIVVTFLLCSWMLYIYHQYTEFGSELENAEKLKFESLKKVLGSDVKYVIRANNVKPDMAKNSTSVVHDHILGEFSIVCMGIFFIGLLVLGAVIDFRKPTPNPDEMTTANYSEIITRF